VGIFQTPGVVGGSGGEADGEGVEVLNAKSERSGKGKLHGSGLRDELEGGYEEEGDGTLASELVGS
jgi:hypothetical protein